MLVNMRNFGISGSWGLTAKILSYLLLLCLHCEVRNFNYFILTSFKNLERKGENCRNLRGNSSNSRGFLVFSCWPSFNKLKSAILSCSRLNICDQVIHFGRMHIRLSSDLLFDKLHVFCTADVYLRNCLKSILFFYLRDVSRLIDARKSMGLPSTLSVQTS